MQNKNYKYHHTDAMTPRQQVDWEMHFEMQQLLLKDKNKRDPHEVMFPKNKGQQTTITAIRHGLEDSGILDRRQQVDYSFRKATYKKRCDDELLKAKKKIAKEVLETEIEMRQQAQELEAKRQAKLAFIDSKRREDRQRADDQYQEHKQFHDTVLQN